MSAKPGQIALRRFPHEEAQRRYAGGESVADLAREYGVSWSGMARVVNPRVRKKMDAQSYANLKRRQEPCKGGCGKLVWTHGREITGYCAQCLGEKRNVVRHGTETEYRQGCRCRLCLDAATAAKRLRRERSRVPCSHGCGTLVDGINRGDNSKPPECRACSMRRVWAEKRARMLKVAA